MYVCEHMVVYELHIDHSKFLLFKAMCVSVCVYV